MNSIKLQNGMDTRFMNSKNSATSDTHRLLLDLTDKANLKSSNKYVPLSNFTIYYTWKNMKKSCKNKKFKISAATYHISHIQDYFECILKKHGEKTDNPSTRIYVYKIQNKITFKIKTGYYLKMLPPKTRKLLESIKNKITKNKNGENVSHLEITKVILVNCNIVNNDHQHDPRVLYTFVPKKSFSQLLDILPKSFIFLKTFDSEFSYIEIWFTDQNSKPLEIERKINITLVIN